jgi:hypothetical protein
VNDIPNSHLREKEIIETFIARHMLYFKLTQKTLEYSYAMKSSEDSNEDRQESRDISDEEKKNDIEEIRRVMNFKLPAINGKFIENSINARSLATKEP